MRISENKLESVELEHGAKRITIPDYESAALIAGVEIGKPYSASAVMPKITSIVSLNS